MSYFTSKSKSISTHHKMMKTQLIQIAEQVSHVSRPQGHLLNQLETSPKR